jgi:transaldolase
VNFRVKLFADGAELGPMMEMYRNPCIKGFTTNPTLMRKAGISDYRAFAKEVVAAIPDRPISFEVFADDFPTMERQATEIAAWGDQVYVKIPITNTEGKSCAPLIERLVAKNIKLNVTAIMTLEQVNTVVPILAAGPSCNISIFAGRIADTGRDPIPVMEEAMRLIKPYPHIELIWASPREVLNVWQADSVGCHIITATTDILKKLGLAGKDLVDYSLETVQMFYTDGQKAGFTL